MFEHLKQTKAITERVNRALQVVLAHLILIIGALLLAIFILQFPKMLTGMFSGDPVWSKAFLMDVAAIAIAWLQWRYRHYVYPQLRRCPPNEG